MSAAQRKIDLIFNYFVARVRAAGVLSVLHRSCNSKILNQRKNTCWGVGEYSAWNALSADREDTQCVRCTVCRQTFCNGTKRYSPCYQRSTRSTLYVERIQSQRRGCTTSTLLLSCTPCMDAFKDNNQSYVDAFLKK